VLAPVPGRFARVVFGTTATADPRSAAAVPPPPAERATAEPPNPLAKAGAPHGPLLPWVADAIARLTIDDEHLSSVAADGNTLVVTTSLPPAELRTAMLFRSIFRALAAEDGSTNAQPLEPSGTVQPLVRGANPSPLARRATALAERPRALAEREILTIPDADLRAWERPAGALDSPRLDTIDRDDRRWWWAAALLLLALETWLRRPRREQVDAKSDVEAARVA